MAHPEQKKMLRERTPMVIPLPQEARGTKIEAILHRDILAERLFASLEKNPHVAFAYTMGSTAQERENEYSDKDIGVVVRTDGDLNYMFQNAGRAYGTFGDLVGYYRYNPYHFYAVYQGAIGPMPLDIYFLTEEMHELMRNSQAKTVVNHIGNTHDSEEHGITVEGTVVENMLLGTYVALENAKIHEKNGDYIKVVDTLDKMRSQLLIHLFRVIEKYNIPHIKAVKLEEFNSEIRNLFIRTFAQPTEEMTKDALVATEALLARLFEDAAKSYNVDSVKAAILELTEGNKKHPHQKTKKKEHEGLTLERSGSLEEETVQLFNEMVDVGLVTLQKTAKKEKKMVVIMQDDESLNNLVEDGAALIKQMVPDANIRQLTPVHLQISKSNGETLDVFLTSSSLYYTSQKTDTLTWVDNRRTQITSHKTVFDTGPDMPELIGERELVVKGIVRTFRLLSKINKNELVTFTYIMNSIRNGQLIPLMRLAGLDIKNESVFPLTYGQPTTEGTRDAVMAAMVLFAEAYIHIRDLYGIRDLDVYVQKAYDAIKDFTQ